MPSEARSTMQQKPHGIEALLANQVQSLAAILQDIQNSIVEREALSHSVLAETAENYHYVKAKLFEIELWPLSASKAHTQRRTALEQQLETLNQQLRNERIQSWRDIAVLKTEARKWFKEYQNLADRVRFILESGK